MTQNEAIKLLEAMDYTQDEIEIHVKKIRSMSKGYWSEPDAAKYMKELTQNKDRG